MVFLTAPGRPTAPADPYRTGNCDNLHVHADLGSTMAAQRLVMRHTIDGRRTLTGMG
jgi:hypothetical protein